MKFVVTVFIIAAHAFFSSSWCAAVDLANPNSPPQILTGNTGFGKQVIATNVEESHAVITGDFDADGDLDIAATDFVAGKVRWFENDGTLNFIPHDLDTNLAGAYPASVADLDQDGDTDILAAGYLADTIVWYENLGAGAFARHDVDTTADGAHSVVAWDPDNDGDLDLLATNQDEGAVLWYENDGSLGFQRHTIDAGAVQAKRAEFGDMDGDGDLDVIACSFGTNEVAWYENDGNETFTKHTITTNAIGSYYAVAADLDSDDDLDILSVSQLNNRVTWYENNGSGSFTVRSIDNDASGARMVLAVDLDRDGDLDALSASVLDNTVGWYENDGTGNFTQRVVDNYVLGAYGIWATDMNGDGNIDVLSAGRDDDTVSLHLQTREHRVVLPNESNTLEISAPILYTADQDNSSEQLTYTITQAPSAGEIRSSGTPVPLGGTFTQVDINADRVTYVSDGTPVFADEFAFTVADLGVDGIAPAPGSFSIYVADPTWAHWPLDETAGSIATDIVGTNNGTLSLGPVWQPTGGLFGGALQFGGLGDRVDLGGVDVSGGDGLTLAMWVQPQATGTDGRMISKAAGTGEQDHYWMVSSYAGKQLRLRLRTEGVTSTLIAPQPLLATGQWTYVVCTYDQHKMRIYGDGVLLASMLKTGPVDYNAAINAAIGNQPSGAGNSPFIGLIDDVRLYNRALLPAEIVSMMVSGVPAAVEDNPNSNLNSLNHRGGRLLTNVPNPFNPSTTIRYVTPQAGRVELTVFNLRGHKVRTLISGQQQDAGSHKYVWHGKNDAGQSVGSGVYLAELKVDGTRSYQRMTLVK